MEGNESLPNRRIMLEVSGLTAERLDQMAEKRGIDISELFRRAIAWYEISTLAVEEGRLAWNIEPDAGIDSEDVNSQN